LSPRWQFLIEREEIRMEESEAEEKNARRFLLGYLSEEERKIVENRLEEPDYLELVLKTEHDLMDDYIANELSENDRLRFKHHVLTNQQQINELNLSRKLRVTARVRAAANSPPAVTEPIPTARKTASNRSWHSDFRVPIAAIIFISIGLAAAFAVFWSNRSSQQLLYEQLTKLNTQQGLSAEAISLGFIIGPLEEGLTRADSKNSFSIPETEKVVQLRLQLGNVSFQTFQAVLQDMDGHDIRKFNGLRARTINGERMMIIYVSATDITSGDYRVRLSGVTQTNEIVELGRYTFRSVSHR